MIPRYSHCTLYKLLSKTAVFLLFGTTFAQEEVPITICYFSLNSPKEYQTMKDFSENIERKTGLRVQIKEFQNEGSDPEVSFKEMIASGTICNGLVISGHHTGSFGGKRAEGSLSIDFLEDMSCNPEYKDWFDDIQALWLQGCRTLGEKIEVNREVSADYHTLRVGAMLEEDHLEQGLGDLNMEFSATLDQDNPLSSRYLRVFPSATVFGWTKTSPGEKALSEHSLPYHIAHIARLTHDRKKYFQNPLRGNLSTPSAVAFASTMLGMLRSEPFIPEGPCKISEEEKVMGWLLHGGVDGENPYYLDNPYLQGFPSLAMINHHREILYRSKEISCLLKMDLEKEYLLEILEEVLMDEQLLGYNFNSMWDLINRLRAENQAGTHDEILNKIKSSSLLSEFITKKLSSKELGSLRKIDYYAFYRDLMGVNSTEIEDKIKQAAQEILLLPPDNYDLRDYQKTLWQSLAKHALIDKDFLLEIINDDKVTDDTLADIVWATVKSSGKMAHIGEVLEEIINHSKTGADTLSYVVWALVESKNSVPNTESFFQRVIEHQNADNKALFNIVWALENLAEKIENPRVIAEQVLGDPRSDAPTLSGILQLLSEDPFKFQPLEKFISGAIEHPSADEKTLRNAVQVIKKLLTKLKYPENLLEGIANHALSNGGTLAAIAEMVGEYPDKVTRHEELLQKVIKHPRASGKTVANAVWAAGEEGVGMKDLESFLQDVTTLSQIDGTALANVAWTVGVKKGQIIYPENILQRIINHHKANGETLINAVWAVGERVDKIAYPREFLKKIKDHPVLSGNILSNEEKIRLQSEIKNAREKSLMEP